MNLKTVIRSTFSLILLSFCTLTSAQEPPNLSLAKHAAKQYHDSGAYEKDLTLAANNALDYLKQHVNDKMAPGSKAAIVLDIDETSLSNYPHLVKLDFGGTIQEIRQLESECADAAIAPVLKLYQYAHAHHIAVIFLTGRNNEEKDCTIHNLQIAGYKHWDKLILRDTRHKKITATLYKTAMRKALTQAGYHIILNVGDQNSDLDGGYADHTVKLPNPFYFIP